MIGGKEMILQLAHAFLAHAFLARAFLAHAFLEFAVKVQF